MHNYCFSQFVRGLGILSTLVILASACDSSSDEETVIRPGYLVFTDKVSEIVVSGPARVGRPVTIGFVTWGSSSCEEPYSDEVVVDGLDAVVTTLDKTYIRPCIYTLDPLSHAVRLTFDEPGEARITVKGWLWNGGLSDLDGEDYEMTLGITVAD